MAKLLSNEHANELPEIFETVRNIQQASRGRPIRRDRGIGGGSSRAYVKITGVTDAANYIGVLLTGPEDDTVIKEDIVIRVKGATTNEFAVDYPAFADVVDDIYYLDGTLLG